MGLEAKDWKFNIKSKHQKYLFSKNVMDKILFENPTFVVKKCSNSIRQSINLYVSDWTT